MLEQKLFFTRNGRYTLWEKLQIIKSENLKEIKRYILDNMTLYEEQVEKKSLKGFIFNAYNLMEENCIKEEVGNMINRSFLQNNNRGSDFNGVIYKLDVKFIELDSIYNLLGNLKELNEISGVQNVAIEIYKREINDCIDIKVSSVKAIEYKENINNMTINTEVRIYRNLGLIIVTDYNEYTHSKSFKNELIREIRKVLLNSHSLMEPYKLSDISLRVLLKRSNKHASKLKFILNESTNLICNVKEDVYDNPLDIQEIRDLYDNHMMFGVKIAMGDNEEKYINVDGEKGKLISRTKNIEMEDIDSFVNLLSEVIKYDYLNVNYGSKIKNIARIKMVGPSVKINSQVDDLIIELNQTFNNIMKYSIDRDIILIAINAFFYSLINKIQIKEDVNKNHDLDERIIRVIKKIFEVDIEYIENLFNKIIEICSIDENCNIINLLDNFITQQGELYANSI